MRILRWDKQNRTGFPLLWGKMAFREACPTSSFSPQGSGKSCREQSGGGFRDGSRHRSRQLRDLTDALLQLDQTFSSACYLSVLLSVSSLTVLYLLILFSTLSLSLKRTTPSRAFISLEFFHLYPCRKNTELATVFFKKKIFVLLPSFPICCLSSLALGFSD